jgi:hypothetical protein
MHLNFIVSAVISKRLFLPEKIFFAVGVSSSDETLVDKVSSAVGTFQTFCMPGSFQHLQDKSIHDKTITACAPWNCCYWHKI